MKGGGINEDYYVPVRYRRGRRWVTVAVSEDRDVATRLAGDAYNGPRDFDAVRSYGLWDRGGSVVDVPAKNGLGQRSRVAV